MDNEQLVIKWQNKIIDECQNRLNRDLTKDEKLFITSRTGFIALESIEDTIKTLDGQELFNYLKSEEKQ